MDFSVEQRNLLTQLESEVEQFSSAWDETRGVLSRFAWASNLSSEVPQITTESQGGRGCGSRRFLDSHESLFGPHHRQVRSSSQGQGGQPGLFHHGISRCSRRPAVARRIAPSRCTAPSSTACATSPTRGSRSNRRVGRRPAARRRYHRPQSYPAAAPSSVGTIAVGGARACRGGRRDGCGAPLCGVRASSVNGGGAPLGSHPRRRQSSPGHDRGAEPRLRDRLVAGRQAARVCGTVSGSKGPASRARARSIRVAADQC